MVVADNKITTLTKEPMALTQASRGAHLKDLPGVGPVVAAPTLADVRHQRTTSSKPTRSPWTASKR